MPDSTRQRGRVGGGMNTGGLDGLGVREICCFRFRGSVMVGPLASGKVDFEGRVVAASRLISLIMAARMLCLIESSSAFWLLVGLGLAGGSCGCMLLFSSIS